MAKDDWSKADQVAATVEQADSAGRYWGATSMGDGQVVSLEAHDGSTATVSYTDNGDGSWSLHEATIDSAGE